MENFLNCILGTIGQIERIVWIGRAVRLRIQFTHKSIGSDIMCYVLYYIRSVQRVSLPLIGPDATSATKITY